MARLAIAKGFLGEYAKLDHGVQRAVDAAITAFARNAHPGQQLELALRKRSHQEAPMAICPNGHDSASSDFCDLCGTRIASRYDQQVARGKHQATPSVADGGGGDACPRCGTTRVGQFCETCGYKFGTAQPPWAPAPHVPAPPSGTAFSSAPAPAR